MQIIITADCHRGRKGYDGAGLELPAGSHAMEDALQRAHVPEGGDYGLRASKGWPGFARAALLLSGRKTLQELNVLADRISRMDEAQLGAYEGILKLRQDSDVDHPISMKELINAAYNVDGYEFHPGVLSDHDLGAICLQEEMLDLIRDLPDEVYELLDEEKVGQALRRVDQGTFTSQGYVYRSSKDWQEAYDGVHLPELPGDHDGLVSLRLERVDGDPDTGSSVWLELPANEQAIQCVLASLGETSRDRCVITDSESILPSLKERIAGDEGIDRLNTLARRLAAFPDLRTLMKYKAVLELEGFPDLDTMLDLTQNLDRYDFDRNDISPAAYGEILLKEGDINVEDPAFDGFDFKGYGEREMAGGPFIMTPYGSVARSDMVFIQEYAKPQTGMTMT